MQLRAWGSFAASVLAGFAWWACSNASAGGGGGVADAGEAGEDAGDAAAEGPECNPCFQFCACTPGQTVYSPFQCMTYTCPPTGVWGAMGCTGPSKCADAAEDPPVPVEASPEASTDAPVDGSVPIDASTDAARDAPAEAAVDAPAEAAGD